MREQPERLIVLGTLANRVQSVSTEPERRIVIAETAGGVHRVQLRCAWADRTTYGVLTATDLPETELATLLVTMRTDLEQTK